MSNPTPEPPNGEAQDAWLIQLHANARLVQDVLRGAVEEVIAQTDAQDADSFDEETFNSIFQLEFQRQKDIQGEQAERFLGRSVVWIEGKHPAVRSRLNPHNMMRFFVPPDQLKPWKETVLHFAEILRASLFDVLFDSDEEEPAQVIQLREEKSDEQ